MACKEGFLEVPLFFGGFCTLGGHEFLVKVNPFVDVWESSEKCRVVVLLFQ